MGAKLISIINQHKKKVQVEQDFLRRYPRDGVGRSKRRPFRATWMRNKVLSEILRRKGIYSIAHI